MADTLEGRTVRSTSEAISHAIQSGQVTPLFQPIEALQTGHCRGFEALARLRIDDRLLTPDLFLPGLRDDDRLSLFGTMLGEGIALLKAHGHAASDLYVSVNVEISLIVGPEFVDILRYFLERYGFSGERLVLEILENEDVGDMARLHVRLEAIRRLGLSVALDDIGSAYASLSKIKQLPIDVIKLDRGFGRDLERRPEDLMFVMSMLSLARGLGKRMIVEGIESLEVYDALRMMGVELGQGYAIARPMPAAAVADWLAARRPRVADRLPACLLGAYASHLTVVEACRVLRSQPLPIAWTPAAADHENCAVGRLFGPRGWHDTAFGVAHRAFHAVLPFYETEPDHWNRAARHFQDTMAAAIAADVAGTGCRPPGRRTAAKRMSSKCGCADAPVAASPGRRRVAVRG